MRFSFARIVCLLALGAALPLAAGEPNPDEGPMVTLEDGKIYRKVNDEPITGRDVLDLVLEQKWAEHLSSFVEYALRAEEVQAGGISVSDADVEAELQALIDHFAKAMHLNNPADLKLEKLAREIGLKGSVAALRREIKVNLGLLRLIRKEKGMPAGKMEHVWDQAFKAAASARLEKVVTQKGVERDPKKLGAGEAVRIGAKSYSRDEVRSFVVEEQGQIALAELKEKLEILALEKLVQGVLKEKKLELTEDDLSFHFSYLCRRKEAATGVDGRAVMAQDLQTLGMTPEQFMHDRRMKADAGITVLAKAPIRQKQLKAEFAAHPERYKRVENLVAHILIRVLDPDGRPYTPLWKAPGHEQLNEYAARSREERFAAAKPKIEGLIAMAKQDFDGTAKKCSEDAKTSSIGGVIGRIGKDAIIVGSLDNAVRDAAVALKPGEVAGPVRSAYGWHLVKCLEKQDVTYEEAEERIYLQLIFETREKVTETLLQKAKIEDKLPR
jgi:hypothetical protein